jgi:hypothetical protein
MPLGLAIMWHEVMKCHKVKGHSYAEKPCDPSSPLMQDSVFSLLYGSCKTKMRRYSRFFDRLYGLVVRVAGYRSGGSRSILGATRFSEK